MANPDLEKYIQKSREKKVTDEETKAALVKAGWSEEEVISALATRPSVLGSSALPTPPVPRVGMWVGFLYIILFISLYVNTTAFSQMLKIIADDFIIDSLDKRYYSENSYFSYFSHILGGSSASTFYLAALIVSFPIFGPLFLYLKKQQLTKPAIKNLHARKLLIYITLVGTFLIMVFDSISTVYGYLNGLATGRSLTHFAITMSVSGSIFLYYLFEVKEDRKI